MQLDLGKEGTCHHCHHQYEHFVITYMTSYISKNCRNIKEMGVRIVLWWCQEVHHLQFTNKLTSQSIYEHVRGQNARSASMVLCMKWIVHAGGVCQCSHHHHHQQTCRPCWIIFVIKSMMFEEGLFVLSHFKNLFLSTTHSFIDGSLVSKYPKNKLSNVSGQTQFIKYFLK